MTGTLREDVLGARRIVVKVGSSSLTTASGGLDAGLLVTVNSDDPSYFGGYVEDNFQGLRTALGLTDGQLVLLARNSFLASFVDDARRAELLAELDDATRVTPVASAG